MKPRRILVALDDSQPSRAALEEAARLAAALDAELLGVFVEDAELLDWAGLPFSRAVTASSPRLRRVDPEGIQRSLRAQAQRLRAALKKEAEGRRLRWSFTVRRGRVPVELEAVSDAEDLLLLGSRGIFPGRRAGSTAARVARRSRGSVWLMPPSRLPGSTLLVLFGNTPGAERTLRAAVELPSVRRAELRLLLPPGGDTEALSERAQALVGELGRGADMILLRSSSAAELEQICRRESARALVLSGDEPELESMIGVAGSVDCPVYVVR